MVTQGDANSVIFNQFIYADGFAKLLSVLEQQLKVLPSTTRAAAAHAPHLRPILDVLAMLLRVYENTDRRGAVQELVCVILHKYRDVSFVPGDDVEGMLGDAVTVLELLLECSGKLSFDTSTNEYTTTVLLSNQNISEMRNLLSGILGNDEFCVSMRTMLGKMEVSLPTAGKICRLLRCLLFFHECCRDPSSSSSSSSSSPSSSTSTSNRNAVIDGLFPNDPALLRSHMMRLLSKEADEAVLNTSALGRMCSILRILSQLSPVLQCPSSPQGGPASPLGGGPASPSPYGNSSSSHDSALSRCVMSLKHWTAAGLLAAHGNPSMDYSDALSTVKALLLIFINDASQIVGNPDPTLWPASSTALCALKDSVRLLVIIVYCRSNDNP